MKANKQLSTNPRADPCRHEHGRVPGPYQRCLSPKSLEEEKFPHLTAAIFLSVVAELIPCIGLSSKTLKTSVFSVHSGLCSSVPFLCLIRALHTLHPLLQRSVIKRSLTSAQPAVLTKCGHLIPLMSSALLSHRVGISTKLENYVKFQQMHLSNFLRNSS